MIKGEATLDGKKIEFVYPGGMEEEMKVQILEVYKREQYKRGRRKKDAIYLDVGANVGNATRYFYPYAKKIYSIEPNPTIYQCLVENTKDLKNIETFNVALAHGCGTDYMYSNAGGPQPQSFYGDDTSVTAIKVNMMDIRTFFNQNKIEHIDVMKIDAEGAEYIILAGSPFLEVAHKIDYIIGEAHHVQGGFPDVLKLVLEDAGFNKFRFIKDGDPNYYRDMEYYDTEKNIKKRWAVPYYTMFEAWRE